VFIAGGIIDHTESRRDGHAPRHVGAGYVPRKTSIHAQHGTHMQIQIGN